MAQYELISGIEVDTGLKTFLEQEVARVDYDRGAVEVARGIRLGEARALRRGPEIVQCSTDGGLVAPARKSSFCRAMCGSVSW